MSERERRIEVVAAGVVEVCWNGQIVRGKISPKAAERILDAVEEAVPVVSEAEVERLRKIEVAARWVRENWDRKATQHDSMPALREALDGNPEAPTRADQPAAAAVPARHSFRGEKGNAEAGGLDGS